MKVVVDAYAWVEYFLGSSAGAKVQKIVEDERNLVLTSAVTVAELSSKFARAGESFTDARSVLLSLSAIEPISWESAEEVGVLHAQLRKTRKHFGLADAFVLHAARKSNATVLTGDDDFRGLPNVRFVKR
jgi:predicted nucleic acid-binding protein